MNWNVADLFTGEMGQRVGWAIMHFVWQGLAVAAAAGIALQLMHRGSARARYAVACAALGALVILPVMTAAMVSTRRESRAHAMAVPLPTQTSDSMTGAPAQPVAAAAGRDRAQATPPAAQPEPLRDSWREGLRRRMSSLLPWAVTGWAIGVAAISLWQMIGWLLVQRIRRMGSPLREAALLATFERLRLKLAVTLPVRLLESAMVKTPMVIGWLRPAILLPLSVFSGLSPQQVEAILAHELAHVKRLDCLVRMVQAGVETVLFFHPAVWWVSRRVTQESEHCCDEWALEVCGDREEYARALARVAGVWQMGSGLGAGARGGKLLPRLRRILGVGGERRKGRTLAGAVVALSLVLGLAPLACMREQPSKQNAGAADAQDYANRIRALVPNGWTVTVAGDTVNVVRDRKVRGELELPNGPGIAAGEDPYKPYQVEMTLRIQPRMPVAEWVQLARENEEAFQLAQRAYELHPIGRPPSAVKHRLPTHYDDQRSVSLIYFQSEDWFRFESKDEARECDQVYRAIAAMFQMYTLTPEIPAEDQIIEGAWGNPNQGLQVRLQPSKSNWRAGETPELILEVKNAGAVPIEYSEAPMLYCQVQVNGAWYSWSKPFALALPTGMLQPGKDFLLKIRLTDDWATPALGLPGLAAKNAKPLQFSAGGSYLARVSFTGYPEIGKRERGIRCESNPVELDIGPSQFYITGNIEKPGAYMLNSATPLTLLQAIASAGKTGLDPHTLIDLTRCDSKNRETIRRINASELAARDSGGAVLDGDVILVLDDRQAWNKAPAANLDIVPAAHAGEDGEIYLMGAVPHNGVYSVGRKSMTLKQALAMSGMTPEAMHQSTVTLTRRVGENSEETVEVDLAKLLEGTAPDHLLQPNDILNVKTAKPPATSAPATAR